VSSAKVARDTEVFRGLDQVDKVMIDTSTIFHRWLGRANVHIFVDGDGIEREDFSVNALGQCNRDATFPRSGWSSQYNRIVHQ
jgi:hypothetical protein